ncbi:hypothetical protein [Kineococcus aurantiacus]|uniref:Uncharacterized protein n=1 Tax=Kineococcus aurantiacus TaxID=37633 RepID=A0A7Y9J294_9ACTN|nr:hypothetical protein [Kineococcus aurantiacus]NYD23976.1 hypothetical protein [Kineococcus aurantiacus]
MWDTWQEEMEHWSQQRWGQWFDEHEQQRVAERERSRREAVERRLRIEQRWTPSGDPERDAQQRSELYHQDRLEHPHSIRREWEEQQALRRQEVLTYPTLPLRHHTDLQRPEGVPEQQDPRTVGFGPSGEALALWGETSERATHLSRYDCDGQLSASMPLETVPWAFHVQPLPHGQVLVVEAGGPRAAVHDGVGRLVRTIDVGRGVTRVLSTVEGQVWIGYDKESPRDHYFSQHGLVRFGADLTPHWRYPLSTALPDIYDCLVLNVDGEAAWTYSWTSFHLVGVHAGQAQDHGRVPVDHARAVLVADDQAATISGYGGEDDVLTPLRLATDSIWLAGSPARLVLPGGADLPRARYTSRGPDLHAVIGTAWYRLSLDDVGSRWVI